MTWPDDDVLLQCWPQLGHIDDREPAGRGLRLQTASGAVHLRQRGPERMAVELEGADLLAGAGLRVPRPLATAGGERHVIHDGQALFCYPELAGHARLDEFWAPDVTQWMERIGRANADFALAAATVDLAPLRALDLPVRPTTAIHDGLPHQLTHRDLHTGNILLDDHLPPGYLDLDHFEYGPAVVDLAYCGASPLASILTQADERGIGQDEAVAHWREVWAALRSGYEQVRPLSDAERAILGPLMVEIEEDFASWFAQCGMDDHVTHTRRMIEILRHEDPSA